MNQLEQMKKLRMLMESPETTPSKKKCKTCDKNCTKTYCSKACKEKVNESSANEKYKRINHYGLTEIFRGKNTTDIYHGGNMGNTLDNIKENVDKILGPGIFDKLLKYGKQEGSPMYSYSLHVPNKYYDQIVSTSKESFTESSTKEKKCKTCDKACTKTFCSKKCENKVAESIEIPRSTEHADWEYCPYCDGTGRRKKETGKWNEFGNN